MVRPVRPIGLSLAIIANSILFSILPLMQVGLVIIFRGDLNTLQFGNPTFFQGAEISSMSDGLLLAQAVFSLLFVGIAIMAWRGRARHIRQTIVAASILLAGLSLAAVALGDTNVSDNERAFLGLRLAFQLAAALYLTWYMNRGPARAYYAGHAHETH
jgi:hypothetical protein